MNSGPLGIFDSGLGGLTVLQSIKKALPDISTLYFGDSARAPYGTRSFETVYRYTRQGVQELFDRGCPLVILACNTASARALRTLQQKDLPMGGPSHRRILGVIIPAVELVGKHSSSGHVGILATEGTLRSGSYETEVAKRNPHLKVTLQAAPMLVPLVECGELTGKGSRHFVEKYVEELLKKDERIDTILLACTHYPHLMELFREVVPPHVILVDQGSLVADRLVDYFSRHPDMAQRLASGPSTFLCSERADIFRQRSEGLVKGHEEVIHRPW